MLIDLQWDIGSFQDHWDWDVDVHFTRPTLFSPQRQNLALKKSNSEKREPCTKKNCMLEEGKSPTVSLSFFRLFIHGPLKSTQAFSFLPLSYLTARARHRQWHLQYIHLYVLPQKLTHAETMKDSGIHGDGWITTQCALKKEASLRLTWFRRRRKKYALQIHTEKFQDNPFTFALHVRWKCPCSTSIETPTLRNKEDRVRSADKKQFSRAESKLSHGESGGERIRSGQFPADQIVFIANCMSS